MDTRLLILYLDRAHVGDTMFVKELSSRLMRLGPEGPFRIIVHESGPQTEQALEGRGLFVDRENGVFAISSAREQAIVERSIRQTNRRVVSLLTDHQVTSVSVQGSVKGLMRWSAEEGVVVGPTGWIRDLYTEYVTPVVSSLAIDDASGAVRELPGALTVSALADALDDRSSLLVVYFSTDKGLGIRRDDQWMDAVSVDELNEDDPIADLETVSRLVRSDVPVLITSGRGLKEDRWLRGTRILPD